MVKIKICCIQSLDEAKTAILLGASAIGLVSEMPSGPGVISEDLIAEISSQIPPDISTFLLTSKQNTDKIIEQLKRCKTNSVQIVDDLIGGNYSDIREELPNINIVQVIHVTDEMSIEKTVEISEQVDSILLDSGNKNLTVKELGGTGRTHDWNLSRKIVQEVKIPVYLAGGINASNVTKAINTVKPFGIDLCSSVRTNGKLDKNKLTEFFNILKSLN